MPWVQERKIHSEKNLNLESEATKKLKAGASDVEGSALAVANQVSPETVNIHATLGIAEDDFAGEDKHGLDLLNLAVDGAP